MLSGLICEPHMCSELKLDMMNQLVGAATSLVPFEWLKKRNLSLK